MEAITLQTINNFVTNSNRIEGESTDPAHPLFKSHVECAWRVANSRHHLSPTMRSLHSILLRSEPSKFPGEYRQCNVWVGASPKMSAEEVREQMPRLMAFADRPGHPVGDDASKAQLAMHIHHWYEHIHPFIDGNGRTGRLLLNHHRLKFGLPWQTVLYVDRWKYYNGISDWEHDLFQSGLDTEDYIYYRLSRESGRHDNDDGPCACGATHFIGAIT